MVEIRGPNLKFLAITLNKRMPTLLQVIFFKKHEEKKQAGF